MGRHKSRSSRRLHPTRPLAGGSYPRCETKRDGDHVVRNVPAGRATKIYTCPGCLHPIPPGTPHIVAWPHDAIGFGTESPVSQRRHWHTGCWQSRP